MKFSVRTMGLLPRIIVAICLGVLLGYALPLWAARIFATFNALFGQFLGFFVPLLILGLVAPAIIDIGHRAGRMLLLTVALAYVSTALAGVLAYGVGQAVFPSLIPTAGYVSEAAVGDVTLEPYFTFQMPSPLTVTSALILAFVLGLTGAHMDGDVLRRGLGEFRQVIIMVIRRVIVPLLPLYIFGVFLGMTVNGQAGAMMATFAKVVGVIFVLHVVVLVVWFMVGGAVDRRNPLKCLWMMMPAYFTALGTSSSAATIPVTLRQTKDMGVDPDVADFTVPLCATIHMSGSALKLTACALALMIAQGMHYDLGMFATFIAMVGVSIVAAPGVPGGAVMASLGLLSSILGFSDADNALMIALYLAMDSFGTACNVTCDGALALIVDRWFGDKQRRHLPQGV